MDYLLLSHLGQYLWSQRRDEAARQAIAQSEAYAEQYAMTYEAALAQAWRGRLHPRKNAATSRQHARTRLIALGATVDVDQITGWERRRSTRA